MYDKLVKRLREMPIDIRCAKVMREAADAIEKLLAERGEVNADSWKTAFEVERDEHRWIPVTERLPEDNEAVNVVWVNHSPVFYYQHIKDKPQTATGVYYRGKWYWWSADTQDYLAEYGKWEPDLMDAAIEVTHWMPLPEPPKEEQFRKTEQLKQEYYHAFCSRCGRPVIAKKEEAFWWPGGTTPISDGMGARMESASPSQTPTASGLWRTRSWTNFLAMCNGMLPTIAAA